MTALPLFASEKNVIQFSGSIFALPLKAVSRCIKDAVERKMAETCSGKGEGATIVHTQVHDDYSTTGDKVKREIVLKYD